MGGSQSQEERVVTVENAETINVTQDFLNYIHKQSEPPPPYKEPPHVGEAPYISAEELLGRPREEVRDGYEADQQKMKELAKLTREEIENTVTQIQGRLVDTRLSGSPVCEDHKEKVLECYHSNPKQTLNCSSEVSAYLRCVEKARKEQVCKSEATVEH